MGFSGQEYWTGLPYPPPGDLTNPGVEPASLCLLHWQARSLPLAPPGKALKLFKTWTSLLCADGMLASPKGPSVGYPVSDKS